MKQVLSIVLIASLAVLAGCASARSRSRRAQSGVRSGGGSSGENETWPRTVPEAVARILASFSEDDKATLRATPEGGTWRYHFEWGMGIRNDFGLWRGNRALLASCGSRGLA